MDHYVSRSGQEDPLGVPVAFCLTLLRCKVYFSLRTVCYTIHESLYLHALTVGHFPSNAGQRDVEVIVGPRSHFRFRDSLNLAV